MIFFADEKHLEKKWYQHEIEDLRDYAKTQGFTVEQEKFFVRKSVENLIRSKYESVLETDTDIQKFVDEELERLGLDL